MSDPTRNVVLRLLREWAEDELRDAVARGDQAAVSEGLDRVARLERQAMIASMPGPVRLVACAEVRS